jgi:ribosomal protein S18 acetylase RimI-like enzyme
MHVRIADLNCPDDQAAIVDLTQVYAMDAMGCGRRLDQAIIDRLIPGLQACGNAIVFLAFEDYVAIGIATCFTAFSTFMGKPLINIHDIAVRPEYRGSGVGKALLAAIEHEAIERHCGKITLEVLEDNVAARKAYHKSDFKHVRYGSPESGVLFYSKSID